MESLRQELISSKRSTSQKHQVEIDKLKSSLATSTDLKAKLDKDILTLKSEITRVQSTNQQLKAVARKYRTQCEELQKQVANTSSSSGVSSDNSKENSTELTSQIMVKDEKISALEEKLATTLSQLEVAKQEIINANLAKNAEFQSQSNETDQRVKKITSAAQQRINELKRIIVEKNNEIAALRDERQIDDSYLTNQPSTSKASFTLSSNSSKMPSSSTLISRSNTVPSSSFESVISSNIHQPSSSNEEIFNLDSLQSTQITSHSTSDDNSSELFISSELFSSTVADSNVSSNKRGYSSDSDPDHLNRKTRRSEPDVITTNDEEDEVSNQSAVVNIEEDSNDDSAAVDVAADAADADTAASAGSTSANYTPSNEEVVEPADNDTQMSDSQLAEPSATYQDAPNDDQQDQHNPNSASSCN